MIPISIDPDSLKQFETAIEWLNKINKKSYQYYEFPNGSLGIGNFDGDYNSLFELGYNVGVKNYNKYNHHTPNYLNDNSNNINLDFKIISGDDMLIITVIEQYNKKNNTRFEVKRFEYDEVIFAELHANSINASDVFGLGYLFGVTSQEKRVRNEIDW